MRIIITNMNPYPLSAGDLLLPTTNTWWCVCLRCRSHEDEKSPGNKEYSIEAECEQHATDYALSHARLSHAGEPVTLVIEHQLVLELPATAPETNEHRDYWWPR